MVPSLTSSSTKSRKPWKTGPSRSCSLTKFSPKAREPQISPGFSFFSAKRDVAGGRACTTYFLFSILYFLHKLPDRPWNRFRHFQLRCPKQKENPSLPSEGFSL